MQLVAVIHRTIILENTLKRSLFIFSREFVLHKDIVQYFLSRKSKKKEKKRERKKRERKREREREKQQGIIMHNSTINRILKSMLILCGIWPGTTSVVICRVYWVIALAIDEICHYRYLLFHFHSNDLFDLMDCFSSFLTQMKFTTKLIVFWWNEQ